MVEHMLERRVGDDAAVPIKLAVDLHRREPRRKRARRHDMLGSDSPIAAIEIDEIARPDVDRSRTIAYRAIVQQVEVDELQQRVAKRLRIITAERGGRRSEEHPSEIQSKMRK